MNPWWVPFLSVILGGLVAILSAYVSSRMNLKTERLKQEFQMKQARDSIIFAEMKTSFKRLIVSMDEAAESLARHQRYDDVWEPLDRKKYDEFRKTVAEESLFLPAIAARAIDLFVDILSDAVLWDWEAEDRNWQYVKDKDAREAYDELSYLTEQLTIYFREYISDSTTYSLESDLDLLIACRFVVGSKLEKLDFQGSSIIKLDGNQSPFTFFRSAKKDLGSFVIEFGQFIEFLKGTLPSLRHKENTLRRIANAEFHLEQLQRWTK